MISRVSPKWKHRRYYYDKGITVCDDWLRFPEFKEWALKNGYRPELELDRINNDLGYSPDNCRFVTKLENNSNRSNTIMVDYEGERVSLTLLCKRLNMPLNQYNTIRRRLSNGWTDKDAIETPIRSGAFGHKGTIKVIDVNTFKVYDSLKDAAQLLNVSKNHLCQMLKGKRSNKTTLRYL